MAEKLPPWEQRWAGNGDRIVDVEVSAGKSTLKGLHKEPDVAIAIVEAEAGTVYDYHAHEGAEIITVIDGAIEFIFQSGFTKICHPKDTITIPPGMNHMAYFLKETRAVAVTVPAEQNFPGGGRFSDRDNYPI